MAAASDTTPVVTREVKANDTFLPVINASVLSTDMIPHRDPKDGGFKFSSFDENFDFYKAAMEAHRESSPVYDPVALSKLYIETSDKLEKHIHTARAAGVLVMDKCPPKTVTDIVGHMKRQAELLMMNRFYAEARVKLVMASSFFQSMVNLKFHAPKDKKDKAELNTKKVEALFPIPLMYNLYILCSELVRDINEACKVADGCTRIAEYVYTTAKDDARNHPKDIKKIEHLKEARRKFRWWDGINNQMQQGYQDLLEADRKLFREEHGQGIPDYQIDSVNAGKYIGGLFRPYSLIQLDDYHWINHEDSKTHQSFPKDDLVIYDLFHPDGESSLRAKFHTNMYTVSRAGLIASRDFKKGDLISSNAPMLFVTVDDNACSTCGLPFSELKEDKKSIPCPGPCNKQVYYCSETCLTLDKSTHSIVCSEKSNIRAIRQDCRRNGVSTSSRAQYLTMNIILAWRDDPVYMGPILREIMEVGYRKVNSSDPKDRYSLKEWSSQYDTMLRFTGLDPLDPAFDFYAFCLLGIGVSLIANVAGPDNLGGRYGVPMGSTIYPEMFFLNHACMPNAVYKTNVYEGGLYPMKLYAIEDIQQGQQIFINYGDIYNIDHKAREVTLQQYGIDKIHSNCDLCRIQRKLHRDEQVDIMMKGLIMIGRPLVDQMEEEEKKAQVLVAKGTDSTNDEKKDDQSCVEPIGVKPDETLP